MTKLQHQTHPDIIKRLKRADGHLRKVIAMIEGGEPCLDVAQQLLAVEKAIRNAKATLVHDHLDHCLSSASAGGGRGLEELRQIAKFLG